jgi:hypothetical protein
VERDEQSGNAGEQEERDELEDLDVSEQLAEDVRGGARAKPTIEQ